MRLRFKSFSFYLWCHLTFLVAQTVKNLPAMWETWVRSFGQEDPVEEEMATHSSILAWETSWTEEPGRIQSVGCRVRYDWATKTFTFTFMVPLVPAPCLKGYLSSAVLFLHLHENLGIFVRFRIWVWRRQMATHSSRLAWKIPWMEEPGRLQSTG